jgi:hypothetical protein
MSNHKQIALTLYDGKVLPEIDEPLAELVRLLNRPDLWTTNCCQGDDPSEFLYDAYVAVDGPLARHLVHRLIDDQIDHARDAAGDFLFDRKIESSAIAIRWHPGNLKSVMARFKRVLSEKAFTRKVMYRSEPGEHVV